MDELHLSYQDTPALNQMLAQWDAQIAAEPSVSRQRWTNITLWPAARSATVAGSTGIEGNPLTAAEVDQVLSGGTVDARPADIREVLNYNSALDLASRVVRRPDFEWTQELLRRLNATVMRDLPDDERGEYRRQPVTVGGVYSPPDSARLPSLMAHLVDWLRAEELCHPLIRAGLTHLNVVSIHPWLNGNGRTARVAGSLMMMRCGVSAPELLNVESAIRADTSQYARVLQTTHGANYDPERHAATAWLEYFAALCVDRLEFRNRIDAAVGVDIGMLTMELDGPQSIERLMILFRARLAPIRVPAMAALLELSPVRVRAIVSALVTAGWLAPIGERRGRRYGPGPRLLDLPLRTPELMERFRAGESEADGQGARDGDTTGH